MGSKMPGESRAGPAGQNEGSKSCGQRRARAVPAGTAALRWAPLPGKSYTWWMRGSSGRGEGVAARGPGAAGRGPAVPAVADPLLAAFAPQSALCLSTQPFSTPAPASPYLSTLAPASPQRTAPHSPAPRLTAPRLASALSPRPPAQPPHRLGGKGRTLASERCLAPAGAGLLAGAGGGNKNVAWPGPPAASFSGDSLLPAAASWGLRVSPGRAAALAAGQAWAGGPHRVGGTYGWKTCAQRCWAHF